MELFVFDDDYVRRLREGDRGTSAHFHAYFRDLLLLKLRRRLPSVDAIDEVRQEVFLRCLAGLNKLEDSRKLGAYVNGICNHVLQEYNRVATRTEQLDERAEEIPDPSDASARYETARSCEEVRSVLKALEPREAAVLTAVFLEEEDKDAICRRLGIERSTLRVIVHRAKKKFRKHYRRR